MIGEKFGNYTYGISIGKRLDPGIVAKVVNGPTLEYYTHYREMNNELSRICGICVAVCPINRSYIE
ncbi:MAG: hypothetical protein IH596_12290 [Bacteroidales bacterium]|nr:hypothetical protein [Bacteroidales bacterium]